MVRKVTATEHRIDRQVVDIELMHKVAETTCGNLKSENLSSRVFADHVFQPVKFLTQ